MAKDLKFDHHKTLNNLLTFDNYFPEVLVL